MTQTNTHPRFDRIKRMVTARQAAEAYGMRIFRSGRGLCPWHEDHHPDLAFYPDGKCYCHACHSGGDAIDLTARMLNLTLREAALRLTRDFRLDTGTPLPPPPPDPKKVQRERSGIVADELARMAHEAFAQRDSADADLQRLGPDGDEAAVSDAMLRLARAEERLSLIQSLDVSELLEETKKDGDALRAWTHMVASAGSLCPAL